MDNPYQPQAASLGVVGKGLPGGAVGDGVVEADQSTTIVIRGWFSVLNDPSFPMAR